MLPWLDPGPFLFYAKTKNMDCQTATNRYQRIRQGFSLVELIISVVLISILAVTVGRALTQTQQQTQQTRAALTQFRQEKNLLENLTEELRWARQILQFSSSGIQFTDPDPANPGSDRTLTYNWSELDQNLYRSCNGSAAKVFLSSVSQFNIQMSDFAWNTDGQRYVRSLMITVQLSANGEDTIQKYVHLSNFPIW
jgi:prepilin-type N-terminal cleavage/methylation domain-containing protein